MTPARVLLDTEEVVVLVDQDDTVVGVAPKLDVHRRGRLHRAVSVVLFDELGQLLLQRRASGKYHSAGLWSNTCCGHPRPGESVKSAAQRRLSHELGIDQCQLTDVAAFLYYADLGDGLVENELDHVLVGCWTGRPRPDPREVSATRWVDHDTLMAELAHAPWRFTAWTGSVVRHACRSAPAGWPVIAR